MENRKCGSGPVRDSRLWDLAAGTPLILFCAFGMAGLLIQVNRDWPQTSGWPMLATLFARLSACLFLALQLALTAIRHLPLAKAGGLAPRLWALLGANSSYVILLLPRVALTPEMALVSGLLSGAGALASAWVLLWLGRSFSVFPQARRLRRAGPYRLVRHPLYLCEQISLFGLCLQFQQPWSLLLVLLGFVLQFPRMRHEERILARTFSDYPAYVQRTPMIVPGLTPAALAKARGLRRQL